MFTSSPSSQKAGVRPISFLLVQPGSFGLPVSLNIRPEDLTRTEPSRVNVTQTLGRGINGWVDNFGQGLPNIVISGHTGWRSSGFFGEDGAGAFETLNTLVTKDYHQAKQDAIDAGMDPAEVKLIFIDMLDDFCYSVAPTQFVLRRSRSRPLLFQYNISMNAVDTEIDNPLLMLPFGGSLFAGLKALMNVIDKIVAFAGKIAGWINTAVSVVTGIISTIAGVVSAFVNMTAKLFGAVNSVISAFTNGVGSIANGLIGIATDIAKVGANISNTLSAIVGIPGYVKHAFGQVGAAYNEAFCILKNSLKPRKTYDNYSGLYGASNCSSTTGGRPISVYANSNAFELMQPARMPVVLTANAQNSVTTLANADPVLAPTDLNEIDRHVQIINEGTTITEVTVNE